MNKAAATPFPETSPTAETRFFLSAALKEFETAKSTMRETFVER